MKRYMIRLALAATALLGASRAANAQWVVFDPTNFAQNVVTAARRFRARFTRTRTSSTSIR